MLCGMIEVVPWLSVFCDLGSAFLQQRSVPAPACPSGHHQRPCEGGTHYTPAGEYLLWTNCKYAAHHFAEFSPFCIIFASVEMNY